jgi:predicted nucleic acid-binding protein
VPLLLWDASALSKRYSPEVGSDTTDALFAAVPPTEMILTFLGYTETYSVLLRKRNQGTIFPATFSAARSALRSEVINDPDFNLLAVDENDFLNSINLMDRHNLNASDAAVLAAYLRYAASLAGAVCALVASDLRLLRAAQVEGLNTINPETLPAPDVVSFLASL